MWGEWEGRCTSSKGVPRSIVPVLAAEGGDAIALGSVCWCCSAAVRALPSNMCSRKMACYDLLRLQKKLRTFSIYQSIVVCGVYVRDKPKYVWTSKDEKGVGAPGSP